jgi:predicted esterase
VERAETVEAVFRADIGNLRILRRYTLSRHNSRLTAENSYENIGPEPIRCLFTQVFTHNTEAVVYPNSGSLIRWQAGDVMVRAAKSASLSEAAVSFAKGQARVELRTRRTLLPCGERVRLGWSIEIATNARPEASAPSVHALFPTTLLARIDRDMRQAEKLGRTAAAAACRMRIEDARRKFALGPGFTEGSSKGRAVPAASLPRTPHPDTTQSDLDYVQRVLSEAEVWMKELSTGSDPFPKMRGLFQRAFFSRWDGTMQPYTVYVPPDWNGRTRLPAIVLLHGAGGDQWEIPQAAANLDGRSQYAGSFEQQLQQAGFLLCSPLARGASRYEDAGEADTLQMIDEVERTYGVDPDRIYLAGWSMGGVGAWSLASRFPDRFAAILPIAGHADADLAGNLRHVPVWSFHGLSDTAVSPKYLREIEEIAGRLGIEHHDGLRERPFVFGPDTDHWVGYRMAGSWNEIERILGRYRRVQKPARVSFATRDYDHRQAYWIRIEAFETERALARVEAEIVGDVIQVTSTNVRALKLLLSNSRFDLRRTVTVIWNGQRVFHGVPAAEVSIGRDEM